MSEARAWASVILINLGMTFYHFHRVAPSFVTEDLRREFHVSAAEIGLFASAFYFTYAAFQIPAGRLVDRLPSVLVAAMGLSLAAMATLLVHWTPSFTWAMVLRIAAGAGLSVFFVCITKRITEVFAPERFTSVHGVSFTIRYLAGTVILYPMALVVAAAGWRALYLAGGIAAALLVLAVALIDRPLLPRLTWRQHTTSAQTEASWPTLVALRRVLTTPGSWPPFFAYLGMFTPHLAFSGMWGLPWLESAYGLSAADAATVLFLFSLGAAVVPPASDRLAEALGSRRRLTEWAAALTTCSWATLAVLAPTKPSLALVAALLTLIGAASYGFVLTFVVVKDLHPPGLLGVATGLQNMAGFLGGIMVQPVIGWVLDRYAAAGPQAAPLGYVAAFWISAAVAAIGLLGAVLTPETAAAPQRRSFPAGTARSN